MRRKLKYGVVVANQIDTVTSLTARLKTTLETDFARVRVKGEIAPNSCAVPKSGHLYFTLGDKDASLKCVWFAGTRQAHQKKTYDLLTGEVFSSSDLVTLNDLKTGGSFLCTGKIDVYPKRGEYQLIVTQMFKAGIANLAQEFERLKAKLLAAGYFDAKRKRAMPKNPRRVALITSASGAVIHDFWRMAQNRGLAAQIRLFPTLVQGKEAVPTIIAAIQEANLQNWAQVIVIIRGGGSLEDLWCFNDEAVATAILNSKLPVLAGIGHEVDFTLADMTADLRAATPTEAAVLLWVLRSELSERLKTLDTHLGRLILNKITQAEQKLGHLTQALNLASPKKRLENLTTRLEHLQAAFEQHMGQFLAKKGLLLERTLASLLQKLRPEEFETKLMQVNLLEEKLNQNMVQFLQRKQDVLLASEQRLKEQAQKRQEALKVQLTKFEASLNLNLAKFADKFNLWLQVKQKLMEQALANLSETWLAKLNDQKLRLDNLSLLLENNNPKVLLQRGYAMIEDAMGSIVSSVTQTSTGEKLAIHLADGVITVSVEQINKSS